MALFAALPFLIIFFYILILAGILYLIYTWVTKFISLREEQNNLLKEIIKRLDNQVK
ncbi:MAG: hypothetical protein WAO52_06400 [Prolixibacteraceae bacterium]